MPPQDFAERWQACRPRNVVAAQLRNISAQGRRALKAGDDAADELSLRHPRGRQDNWDNLAVVVAVMVLQPLPVAATLTPHLQVLGFAEQGSHEIVRLTTAQFRRCTPL